MAGGAAGPRAKLADRELAGLLDGGIAGPLSVLVEPAVPSPTFTPRDPGRPGRGMARSGPADPAARRAVIEPLQRDLEALTGHPPVWLDIGGVFVIEATRDVLAALIDRPDVRRIHLNRKRQWIR
jgi:hypothetical protein